MKKLCQYIILIVLIDSGCKQNGNSYLENPPSEFLHLFDNSRADVDTILLNDTANYFYVGTSTEKRDSLHDLGSFELHVNFYPDSTAAINEFWRWKNGLNPPSELNKAPKYRLRYSRYIYTIECGCINEGNLDSIYRIFRLGIDTTKISNEDLVRIRCGGLIVPL